MGGPGPLLVWPARALACQQTPLLLRAERASRVRLPQALYPAPQQGRAQVASHDKWNTRDPATCRSRRVIHAWGAGSGEGKEDSGAWKG